MPDGTAAVNWTLTDLTDNVVLVANNPVVGGVNTATGLRSWSWWNTGSTRFPSSG